MHVLVFNWVNISVWRSCKITSSLNAAWLLDIDQAAIRLGLTEDRFRSDIDDFGLISIRYQSEQFCYLGEICDYIFTQKRQVFMSMHFISVNDWAFNYTVILYNFHTFIFTLGYMQTSWHHFNIRFAVIYHIMMHLVDHIYMGVCVCGWLVIGNSMLKERRPICIYPSVCLSVYAFIHVAGHMVRGELRRSGVSPAYSLGHVRHHAILSPWYMPNKCRGAKLILNYWL